MAALPAGLIFAALGIIGLVWVHRFLAAAVFGMLRQHVTIIIVVAGLVAAAVVSRRRSMHAARAERSWLAALPVLFITGYAENAVIGDGHLKPGMHVLTKPFGIDALSNRTSILNTRGSQQR
jgi:hypothetical protein